MKINKTIITFFGLLFILIVSSVSAFNDEDNVFYFNWDNNLSNIQGNTSYDGTNHGTTQVVGYIDNGREFDGSSQYISMSSFPRLENITLTAWLKPSTLTGSGASGDQPFSNEDVNTAGFTVRRDNDQLFISINNADEGTTRVTHLTDSFLVINSWAFVTIVIKGDNVKVYYNNATLVMNETFIPMKPNPVFKIGVYHDSAVQYWNGSIDKFAVWNDTFDVDDVRDLYTFYNDSQQYRFNTTAPPPPPPPPPTLNVVTDMINKTRLTTNPIPISYNITTDSTDYNVTCSIFIDDVKVSSQGVASMNTFLNENQSYTFPTGRSEYYINCTDNTTTDYTTKSAIWYNTESIPEGQIFFEGFDSEDEVNEIWLDSVIPPSYDNGTITGTNGYLVINLTNITWSEVNWRADVRVKASASVSSFTLLRLVDSMYNSYGDRFQYFQLEDPDAGLRFGCSGVFNCTGFDGVDSVDTDWHVAQLYYNKSGNFTLAYDGAVVHTDTLISGNLSWLYLMVQVRSGNDFMDYVNITTLNNYISEDLSITLYNPDDNTRTNTNPMDVEYNIDVGDIEDSLVNCSIIINDKINQTENDILVNQSINKTFNITMGNAVSNWYINCSNNITSSVSDTRAYDFDDSEPFITSITPEPFNTTIFTGFNMTIAGNITDDGIWKVNRSIYYPNGSLFFNNYSGELPNVTTYQWSETFDTTSEPNGYWQMHIESADSHTKKYFKPANNIVKDNLHKKLHYEFDFNTIEISLIDGNVMGQFESLDTVKTDDRYSFEFNFKNKLTPNSRMTFRVHSENKLYYLDWSEYNAHFISGDNWIDFEGVDGDFTIKKIDDYNYNVEITTHKQEQNLKFQSLGGLNEDELLITFQVNNCVPVWICDGYGACNTTDAQACNSASDSNVCGINYTGDYSEFSPQVCNYCSYDSLLLNQTDCDSVTDLQLVTYQDLNFSTCCDITKLGSDCLSGSWVNSSYYPINSSCSIFDYTAEDIPKGIISLLATAIIFIGGFAVVILIFFGLSYLLNKKLWSKFFK